MRATDGSANSPLLDGVLLLIAAELTRAADILGQVDFTPSALRSDLTGSRRSIPLVRSAAEIINHAADLCSHSASLVNDNERRWRVFRDRVATVVRPGESMGSPT